jgi:hypothetical protein
MSRWYRQSEEPPSPEHLAYLPRYQQLRRVGLELNNRLMKLLPKDAFQQGGKQLGILKKKTLVFGSEDEMSVLMDFCLHDVRWDGLTTIERCLKESPPADSDELLLLQALSQAHFSLFGVERREAGVGVHVRDLMLDEPLFLMDVGFSKTAKEGMILATRVFAPEGIYRTTGAPLLFASATTRETMLALFQLQALLPEGDFRQFSAEGRSAFTARVIRTCLQSGSSQYMAYAEPGQSPVPTFQAGRPPSPEGTRSSRVGRNDPCPCGSGKKYKQCCLRRD